MAADVQRQTTKDILRGRLAKELDAGNAFLEERVSHLFPGALGKFLNPVAHLLFHVIGRDEVRRRATAQLEFFLEGSDDIARRDDVAAAVARRMDALLATEESHVRGNKKHHEFQRVMDLLRRTFEARQLALARLVNEGHGNEYGAIVRSVFATRDEAERIITRQYDLGEDLLALEHKYPGLLHVPHMVREEVLRIVADAFAWYRERLGRALDEIYR